MRSFGHAAFFGMGGYAVGILAVHYNIDSFWLVLPITLVVCAVLSAIIGYSHSRYPCPLLLVTMAFGAAALCCGHQVVSLPEGLTD